MSNNVLSAFTVAVVCGMFCACLPRLVAPSDNYISDTLGIYQAQIYITSQPSSMAVLAGERVNFIISTNISADVSYQWQFSNDTGETWENVQALGSDRSIFVFTASTAQDGLYYRCSVQYGDTVIFSAPFMLTVNSEPEVQQDEQPEVVSVPEDQQEVEPEVEAVTEEVTEDGE